MDISSPVRRAENKSRDFAYIFFERAKNSKIIGNCVFLWLWLSFLLCYQFIWKWMVSMLHHSRVKNLVRAIITRMKNCITRNYEWCEKEHFFLGFTWTMWTMVVKSCHWSHHKWIVEGLVFTNLYKTSNHSFHLTCYQSTYLS